MVGALGRALGTAADGAAPAVVVLSQSGQPIETLCQSLASTPLPGKFAPLLSASARQAPTAACGILFV